MEAIRVTNLRSLVDTGFIALKPITLLLGQNSSGKSTFLRTFPLLRQSIEARTMGPILWYGQLVDFGSFQEAITTGATEQEIGFSFRLRLPAGRKDDYQLYVDRLSSMRLLDDLVVEAKLTVAPDSRREASYAKECLLTFADHTVRVSFDNEGKVAQFVVNGSDLSDAGKRMRSVQRGAFMPRLLEDSSRQGQLRLFDAPSSFLAAAIGDIRSMVHKNTSDQTMAGLALNIGLGASDRMLESMRQSPFATTLWERRITGWTTECPEFKNLRDNLIAHHTSTLLGVIDEYLAGFARRSYYIAPVRATAERYYRLQGLAVNEVDAQGQNLAMFLRNLTAPEFTSFQKWTEEHFGFSVVSHHSVGHESLWLREGLSGAEYNMADKGFGFSQIVPILTQLWVLAYQRRRPGPPAREVVFAVEQPELHLHPRLQAKLVDAFLDAVKAARKMQIELKLVIETHSETMVNRFGYQIARGYASSEDVSVVLFEKEPNDIQTTVRVGGYDSDGFLTNWPFGFFEPDEGVR